MPSSWSPVNITALLLPLSCLSQFLTHDLCLPPRYLSKRDVQCSGSSSLCYFFSPSPHHLHISAPPQELLALSKMNKWLLFPLLLTFILNSRQSVCELSGLSLNVKDFLLLSSTHCISNDGCTHLHLSSPLLLSNIAAKTHLLSIEIF